MNQPQNLPELLQARLKLGLFNWGKRTVIWTMALGLLSAIAPGLRFLLIGWLIFSALSLAALLLGLKLAKNLRVSTATFPQGMNEPRDVGGDRRRLSCRVERGMRCPRPSTETPSSSGSPTWNGGT